MTTLFISDLHLEESRPQITAALLRFLRDEPGERLYILGDLFESWVGDDEQAPLHEEVKTALRARADSGTALFIMHGNRDFLIGEAFCNDINATLLTDPTLVELYGEAVLLMHGDTLCTGDTAYMDYRAKVRDPDAMAAFLARPLAERQLVAQQMRMLSQAKNQGKAAEIMDVTADEVERVMTEHQVTHLIHGHTHRPAEHDVKLNHLPAKRYVLGDWEQNYWFLRADEAGFHLIRREL